MGVTKVTNSSDASFDNQQPPSKINGVEHCAVNIGFENSGLTLDEVALDVPSKIYGVTAYSNGDLNWKQPINIKWKDISLTTKAGVSILKGLSGSASTGELTAIIGPSGAGKTTLLNILSGFVRRNVTGKVLVNGVHLDLRTFRKLSCYVLQDDHLFTILTTKEVINIAASLKISTSVSKENRKKIVDETIKSFGLEGQINRKVSELSGGQRKRLSIAQEVVNNPPLIFLDEPTSGLDSASCLQCIQLLKDLAKDGRTVVFTMHQPSSRIVDIFDKLYIVADGQCIYRGPTTNLVPFLASHGLNCPQYHNPTDYVLEVALGDYGNWNSKLQQAIDSIDSLDNLSTKSLQLEKKESLEISNIGYATSSLNQFRVLYKRSILCLFKEHMNVHLKLFGNAVVSVLLGSLFYGIGNDASQVFSNISLMFCSLMFILFASGVPYILTYPGQRKIFLREHMNCWYSTKMYFLSLMAADLPFQILFPVVHLLIFYFMTSQPYEWFRVALMVLTFVIYSLISQSFGYLIGVLTDPHAGIIILSSISIVLFLFTGFFISIHTIPSFLRWLSYVSYMRYAFQSILLILYTMDRPKLECTKGVCPFEDPQEFVKEMDLKGGLFLNLSILIVFLLALRITTYFVLRYKAMRKL